jgi:predicted nucleic acid-binding protein
MTISTRSVKMADKSCVYLDACCFIDMVKEGVGHILTSERSKDVWYLKQITQACRDGELEVFTSIITIAECSHADGNVSFPVRAQFESLLMSGQYVKLVQPTPFIATDARDLRWKHGLALRGADAIHVASALDRRCEEFVTTDRQAKKMAAKSTLLQLGLRIIRASETQCLPGKYLQLGLPGTFRQ